MSSYVKISKDDKSKNYLLTSSYNKPYMHISGSVLPLTTNTINGICMKVEVNGSTYRPLEYGSQSASNTYYTSAVNSDGLSSTTALTRSSTSGESYETRASTSSTSYGVSTNNVPIYVKISSFRTNSYDSTCNSVISDLRIHYIGLGGNYDTFGGGITGSYYYTTSTVYNGSTSSRSGSNTYYSGEVYNMAFRYNLIGVYTDGYARSTGPKYYKTWKANAYDQYNSVSITFDNHVSEGVTTGTTYLTRSSTSKTVYLTRSSTYGYSGVSSSSSESSGWS